MSSHKPLTDRTGPADGQDRKLKLAEAGVVFVIVLGICVFLGIRFAQQPLEDAVVQAEPAVVQPLAVVAAPQVAPGDPVPATVSGGTEPAGAVEPTAAAADRPLPDISEIMPEVPIYVTYTAAERTYFEGRYQDAAAMFATYCARHPANAWGHYMHGLSLWKAGRNAEARTAFNSALGLQPDHLKSLVNLARVELELDAPEAALTTIERALDVAPQHVEALRVLGRVYHRLDRGDQAVATYQQALLLRGDDAWTLNNLALIHIEAERFAQALPPLARASELAPAVAVIRNNLGVALERTGHRSQAREQYLLAAELGSGPGESSYVRLLEVTIPASDPVIDLALLADAWSAGEAVAGTGRPDAGTVAALAPDGPPAASSR
jgi:Flp pilus assembly protein TadD